MNFVLYFTIPTFVRALAPQSTVYLIPYSQFEREQKESFVLLTSDAGVEGGTVRVLQLKLKVTSPEQDALEAANDAGINIARFLRDRGVKPEIGLLLTAGLQDAIKFWGEVAEYSLEELGSILEKGKEVALSEQ